MDAIVSCQRRPQSSKQNHQHTGTHPQKPGNARKEVKVAYRKPAAEGSPPAEDLLLGGWNDTPKVNRVINGNDSSGSRREHTEVLRIEGKHYIKFKLDNGSEINSLPLHLFKLIDDNFRVYPDDTTIITYGKSEFKSLGKVYLLVETQHGAKLICDFLISSVEKRPILGIDACETLNLVVKVKHSVKCSDTAEAHSLELPASKELFVRNYQELFTGLGEFKQTVKIIVDPTVKPGICPPRRYNFTVVEKLKVKLAQLEREGMIAKMPFGISCAPEIFQFLTEQAFQGTGAISYFDDCVAAGATLAEHDEVLIRVMVKAKEHNIRFINPSKLQYRLKEVKFVGHMWPHNQMKIDPKRVAAKGEIAESKNRHELQKCLGTFNYVRKFIPQMATTAAPLYSLLSDRVAFHWLPAHALAFHKLKMSLTEAPVLTTFDPKQPIVVQADASQCGLGCALFQGGKIVAVDRCRLTETDRD
ncbi:Transposon Tf2-9 polyprotein [Frankliniella fusca]|uniref:RNA-directed DNA polymerase n=1 Tax=Frankliniella fusca TaxID=407009 RepID=A0AAE1L8J4_9NEOP|nr:Transposon Tf2-9 polyprotein [Frankliniella fusca]